MVVQNSIKTHNTCKDVNNGLLFLDIETTGLKCKTTHLTVIGTAYFEADNQIAIRQFFVDKPGLEMETLSEFLAFSKDFQTLVAFNGNHFDIPYLNEKCIKYRLDNTLEGLNFLDLYKSMKPHLSLFALPNKKQKTIEKLLEIDRRDTISGAECVSKYFEYLYTGNIMAKEALLLHNEDDLIGMCELYLKAGAFDVIGGDFEINELSRISDTNVEILLSPGRNIDFPICFANQFFELIVTPDKCSVILKGKRCELKYFYKDYSNYYYLPEEDIAIHKSVGGFVHSRVNAKASNCYERHNSIFLYQPKQIITPSFKSEYSSKEYYFRYDDIFVQSDETIKTFVISLMRHINKEVQKEPSK